MRALFWSVLFLAAFYSSLGQSFSSENPLNLVFSPVSKSFDGCQLELKAEIDKGSFASIKMTIEAIENSCPSQSFERQVVDLYYKTDQCGSLIYSGEMKRLNGIYKVQLVDHRTRLCDDKLMLPGDFVLTIKSQEYTEIFYSRYIYKQGRLSQPIEAISQFLNQ
jgi:hypothetical protein